MSPPGLQDVFHKASTLKGSHDLSRRAVVYKMTGLSLREFIELAVLDIESILTNHEKYSFEITKKILPVFQEYLRHGYFPYFLEHPDEDTYLRTLEHMLAIPPKGDFIVDDKTLFEIGGKGKTFKQIKDIPDSYLSLDNIEHGMNAKIPLWIFGFLCLIC